MGEAASSRLGGLLVSKGSRADRNAKRPARPAVPFAGYRFLIIRSSWPSSTVFRGGAVPAIQIEAIKPPKRIARGTARRHEVKLIRIGALEAAILDANEAKRSPSIGRRFQFRRLS